MRIAHLLIVAVAAAGLAGRLAAQTPPSPDNVYEQAMTHWRAASWYSHLRDPNITGIEIDTLRTTWQAVAGLPADKRPSLYQKDPDWPQTLAEVSKLIDAASDAADRNDGQATEADLAQIGDQLAAARRRAGTSGFSDAVRSYQAAVDRLSGLVTFAEQRQGAAFDETRRAEVEQATQASVAAAAALKGAIPPHWADDDKLKALIQQNLDSIQALQKGLAQHASGLAIAAAINVVRSNYWLLFLNYG
jgi:hypothetical protein